MLMNLGALVTQVKEILKFDARTNKITWYDGRRSTQNINDTPAGIVSLGDGEDFPFSIPSGREPEVPVLIAILERHSVVGTAEKNVQNWLDKVLELFSDNWDLKFEGVPFSPNVSVDRVTWRFDSNPEAQTPEARLHVTLVLTAHLH